MPTELNPNGTSPTVADALARQIETLAGERRLSGAAIRDATNGAPGEPGPEGPPGAPAAFVTFTDEALFNAYVPAPNEMKVLL